MDDCSFINLGRYQNGWYTNSKPIEGKVVRLGPNYTIQIGHMSNWSWDMIEESSMLIISDEKHHFIPLRTGSDRFIHFLDKLLSLGHIMRRVIIIGREKFDIKVSLLNHNIVGQSTQLRMLLMVMTSCCRSPCTSTNWRLI